MKQELIILSGQIVPAKIALSFTFKNKLPTSEELAQRLAGLELLGKQSLITRHYTTLIGRFDGPNSEKTISVERYLECTAENQDKVAWDFRIELLKELFDETIFSASIVPTYPSMQQTWYIQNRFAERDDLLSESTIKELSTHKKISEDDLRKSTNDLTMHATSSSSQNAVRAGASPLSFPKSATPLHGFVAPFREYSDQKHTPDQRPEINGTKLDASDPRTKNIALHAIRSPSSREKCSRIWECFQRDFHTKELAFTLFDHHDGNSKALRFHLTKSDPK